MSDVFIDSVSDLCETLEGRGAALVQALRRGQVSSFRWAKTNELERYLLEHGYIDPDEPRAADDLWAAVVSDVGAEALEPAADIKLVQDFLARVATPN